MLQVKGDRAAASPLKEHAASVIDLLSMAPLAVGLGVLPLMTGGNDPGWLAGAQLFTLAVAAVLGFAGLLGIPRDRWSRSLAVVLAALAAAALFSTVFSEDIGTSYPFALQWLWLGAAGLLAFQVARRRRGREWLTGVLILAVSIQALWGFYLWLGSRDPSHAQVGTFYAPNQYAGYLILLAPFLFCLCLTAESWIQATGAGLAAAFVYLGIALSGSRGGAVAAGAGLVAMVAILGRTGLKRVLVRSGAFVVAIIGLGFLMTGPVFFHEYHPRGGGVQSVLAVKGEDPASLVMRLHWDVGAADIGAHNLLVGTGLGTFGPVFAKIQKPQWEWSKWAHDQYLEAFAEGGLPLFAAAVALALVALAGGFLGLRRVGLNDPGRHTYLLVGVWGGLVGGSVHLAIDHDWSYAAYALAFVVMAVLAVTPWDGDDLEKVARSPRTSHLAGVVALGTLIAVAGAFVAGHIATERRPSTSALRLAEVLAPYSPAPFEVRAGQLAGSADPTTLRTAAGLLREALARAGLTNRIRGELASVYANLGDLAAARRTYAQALQIAPGDTQGYLAYASFELGAGKSPERAAAVLDQGIRAITPGGDSGGIEALLTARAQVAEDLAGPAAGLPYAERATEVAPSDPNAWANLLGAACRAQDPATAEAARLKVISLGATVPQGSC